MTEEDFSLAMLTYNIHINATPLDSGHLWVCAVHPMAGIAFLTFRT